MKLRFSTLLLTFLTMIMTLCSCSESDQSKAVSRADSKGFILATICKDELIEVSASRNEKETTISIHFLSNKVANNSYLIVNNKYTSGIITEKGTVSITISNNEFQEQDFYFGFGVNKEQHKILNNEQKLFQEIVIPTTLITKILSEKSKKSCDDPNCDHDHSCDDEEDEEEGCGCEDC